MTETRRRFTDAEKLAILEEADKCWKDPKAPGASKGLHALADKYNFYTSAIYEWRRARADGRLKATKETNGVKEEKKAVETAILAMGVAEGPAPVSTPSQTVREEMLLLRVQELEDALTVAMKKADRAETLLKLHKQVAELEAQMMNEKDDRPMTG